MERLMCIKLMKEKRMRILECEREKEDNENRTI